MQGTAEDLLRLSDAVTLDISNPSKNALPNWFYDCFFGVFTGYVGTYYSESVAIASLTSRPIPQGPQSSKREVRLNELIFKTLKHSHDCFLGKLHRDAITGSIVLEDINTPEPFEYVDLAGRTQIKGTIQEILRDDRIFKAEPLVMRSWLYQNMFDVHTSFRVVDSSIDSDQEGPLRSLNMIRERSITLPVEQIESRFALYYSPSLAVLLSLGVALFSLDKSVFLILSMLWALTVFVSHRTNTYSSFRKERIVTLLFRAAVSAWILSLGLIPYKEYFRPVYNSPIPSVLRMASGAIIAADIILGDFRQTIVHAFRSRRYRIRKTFPNNPHIFVCDDPSPGRTNTILPEWINPDRSHRTCLVVDIHGILHLLKPLSGEQDLPNPITTSKAINMASIHLLP